MRRLLSAELLVLRKRVAVRVLLAVWVVLTCFVAYVVPYALDAGDAPAGLEQYLPESVAGAVLGVLPFFGGAFALTLGVFVLGGEYGWDTLKTLFTQGPSRGRVLVAKLLALGVLLLAFVVGAFLAGAATSLVIARVEDAPAAWPSAWLRLRALAAGWWVLAGWACVGVLLGVATRGTLLAIGVGILYVLLVERLLAALTAGVGVLEPVTELFLRADGYSLAVALGASERVIAASGPGAFDGGYVGAVQAVATVGAIAAVLIAWTARQVSRRDVT